MERKFEEDEVRQPILDLARDKAPGPDGLPMVFFQRFWTMLKKDLLAFMEEFHQRGRLSQGMGASFIVLVPKKSREIGTKDYRPISLLGKHLQNPGQSLSTKNPKDPAEYNIQRVMSFC